MSKEFNCSFDENSKTFFIEANDVLFKFENIGLDLNDESPTLSNEEKLFYNLTITNRFPIPKPLTLLKPTLVTKSSTLPLLLKTSKLINENKRFVYKSIRCEKAHDFSRGI